MVVVVDVLHTVIITHTHTFALCRPKIFNQNILHLMMLIYRESIHTLGKMLWLARELEVARGRGGGGGIWKTYIKVVGHFVFLRVS